MSRLLIATRNPGKQAEFRELLAGVGFGLVFPDDIGLSFQPMEDRLERFDTFEENARAKAAWFASTSGLDTLADDSGLEITALDGAPGVHSRRFARFTGSDKATALANVALVLSRMATLDPIDRSARFRCELVLRRRDGRELTATGVSHGRIVDVARGRNGFGYDPIFYSDDLRMTFGEASQRAKDAVSHRSRAAAALRHKLSGGD